MRTTEFIKNEIYLLHNEGTSGEKLFRDDEDRARFLFSVLHLQSPILVHNTHWYVQSFLRKQSFRMTPPKRQPIVDERQIALMGFLIEQTGFKVIVQNLKEMVLSAYMQRVLTAYSKYYNSKYKRHGHVFAGPFKAVHLSSPEKLHDSFENIHRHHEQDVWSSKTDYEDKNRWDELLVVDFMKKMNSYLEKRASLKHKKPKN